MNALKGSLDAMTSGYLAVGRRFPLAVRILELLVVTALYAGGIVLVDRATGQAHLPVVVFAMFAMPIVLSVGVRLFRQLENRFRLGHDKLPHIG